jgi:hypothetical protein
LTAADALSPSGFDPAIGRSLREGNALLGALFELSDGRGQLLVHTEKPWISATFSGARHTFDIVFLGNTAVAAGEQLIAALPDHEFTIPGQLVVKATATFVQSRPGNAITLPELTMTCELLLQERR